MVHDEPAVPEHAMHEVRRRAIQRHDLDRAAEDALELAFHGELRSVQRGRRGHREEDAEVDVAVRPGVTPRDAAEEIGGDRAARVCLEEGSETGFDHAVVHGPHYRDDMRRTAARERSRILRGRADGSRSG